MWIFRWIFPRKGVREGWNCGIAAASQVSKWRFQVIYLCLNNFYCCCSRRRLLTRAESVESADGGRCEKSVEKRLIN